VSSLSVTLQNGRFIPDKSNIWRDSCDGYFDWVKEHINEVKEKSPRGNKN